MISQSQTPVGAMTNNTYWPALDGLRAVSILLVLTVHLRLIVPQSKVLLPAGGFLGVDMFFVISGFLITSLLLSEHRRNGSISLKSFYYKRALRLFPALAAVLLFASFVAVVVGSFSALGLTHVRLVSTIFYFTKLDSSLRRQRLMVSLSFLVTIGRGTVLSLMARAALVSAATAPFK